MTNYSANIFSNALSFDGMDDSVSIPHQNNLDFGLNSFTVEAYVYKEPTTINDWRNIVAKKSTGGVAEGWVLRFNNDRKAAWFLADGTNRVDLASTTSLNDGQWYHLAGVVDRVHNEARLYVNGVLHDTQSLANLGSLSSGANANLILGSWMNEINPDLWEGKIDEVRIWNTARSQTQIQNNASQELTGNETGLTAYYNFNDGTATDLAGNHHGTARGFVLKPTSPSLSLDGVDDYVKIPNNDAFNFDTNDNFTVETWVKADPNQLDLDNNDNDILEKWDSNGGGYPFVIRYLRNTGEIVAARWDTQNNPVIRSTTTINDGKFHHIAFVKDGETLRLYIDGVLEGTQTDTTNLTTKNQSAIYVGRRGQNQPFDNHFRGEVDDFRIWNTARTQSQIQNNANQELTGNETGLIAAYNFNDRTASDLTGNHHGTAQGFVLKPTSPSLSFDGVDDYVDLGEHQALRFDGTQPYTISAWIKPEGAGAIISKLNTGVKGAYMLAINSNGTIRSNRQSPPWNVHTTKTVNFGQWNHVAMTYDGSTLKTYVNGELDRTDTYGSNFNDTSTNVLIGAQYVQSEIANLFQGEIDKVEIWDRALTYTQIQNNANQELTGNETGLIAAYNFDDGTASDLTGNHHGTTQGFILKPTSPSLSFDGVDDYVFLPATATDSGAFTVEAWVYSENVNRNWARVIDFGNGAGSDNLLLAWEGTSGKMRWDIRNGNQSSFITTADVFPENEWVHVAATVDNSGNAAIYWNGQLKASGTINVPRNITRSDRFIGKSNWSNDDIFQGKIDDVRIWNTTRSQTQIQNNASQELTGNETGLVAAYNFNDRTASDLTGNYNGTAQGFTTATQGRFEFDINLNPSLVNFGKDVTQLIVGDFNGDGKDDFIRQEKGAWDNDNVGTAHVYISSEDGNFSRQELTDYSRMKGDLTNLIVGDFNGDGKDDFIRQEKGDWDNDNVDSAEVYISNGDGSFSKNSLAYQENLKGDVTNIFVGDFNGDGKDDFIVNSEFEFESGYVIYLYNGDNTFPNRLVSSNSVIPVADFVVGDFDGDGKDDFIAQGRNNDIDTTQIYLSNGDGNFSQQNLTNATELSHFEPVKIIVGDFNGDGKDDFIRQPKTATETTHKNPQVYLSNGDGSFNYSTQIIWGAKEGQGNQALKGDEKVIVADYNGDNYDDFLVQRAKGGGNFIYLSYGDGTFKEAPVANNHTSNLSDIVVADINGNGRSEILINGSENNSNLSVGFSGMKVDSLSQGSQLSPQLQAQAAQNFALTSYTRYNGDLNALVGAAGQREGTAYGLLSSGLTLSHYATTAIGQGSRSLSTRTASILPLLGKATYLSYGGELISYILAASGRGDVASFFGNGNNPALDLFELTNTDQSLANNSNWLETLEELGLHTAQILLNTFLTVTLLDPVARYFKATIINSINASDPNLNAFFYGQSFRDAGSIVGHSWHGKTNGGIEENRFASIHGTATDDILLAPLYVNGGAGNDAIIGRLDRSDDLYWAYINRVASLIFHKNGTSYTDAYIQPTNAPEIRLGVDLEYNQIEDFDRFITSWDNPGGAIATLPGLDVGFTQTDPGWQDFYNRYRQELYYYFFKAPSKQVVDHLLQHSNDLSSNFHDLNGYGSELRGGADNDTIFSKFDTYVYGDEGDDYIKTAMTAKNVYGGSDDDVIVIEPINDTNALKNVDGGTGNDHLILNGILDIGAAKARHNVPYTYYQLYVRITDTAITYEFDIEDAYGNYFQLPIVVPIADFESIQVLGDEQANYITAGSSANTMYSSLHGLGGGDRLFGSDTGSMLDGGAGDDYLIGGDIEDVLIGGTGKDTLEGRDGADIYVIDSFQNDSQFADSISFYGTEGDKISINLEPFGKVTDEDIYTRFEYQSNLSITEPLPSGGTTVFEGGIITFDGVEIIRLPYPEDFDFQRDVVFTNYWIENPDFSLSNAINGTVANGYIEGATVILDKNFNLQWDEGEDYIFTNELGEYNFEYDLVNYDTNNNGVIDPNEAQIVAIGGIDTTTGLELAVPLITHATNGAIATPTTTIKASLEALGLTSEEANNILTQTLGLNVASLDDFDPYEAEEDEINEGVNVALAHILLHSILVNGKAFLEGVGYTGNSAQLLTQIIAQEINSGAEVELESAAEIDRIFNLALEAAEIDTVSPETVTNVAKLIGVLNDFMEDILKQEEDDDDEEFTVTDKVTNLNPIKHILLGELQTLTSQLSTGEIDLDQALESLDSELANVGFQLVTEEEINENGLREIEYEIQFLNPNLHLVGDEDNNLLQGQGGNDFVLGNEGSDTISGGNGDDFLHGGDGDDSLLGERDVDKLRGGIGNDILDGGDDDDYLYGQEGEDLLDGGDDDDLLLGGTGNDTLMGQEGSDILNGGQGEDIFVIGLGQGRDIIVDFTPGVDYIGLSGGLTWEDLTLQGSDRTSILDADNNILAVLLNVDFQNLSHDDFVSI
ncbi:MAG: hypothetical protein Tsb0014_16970 [Pleurocapsa sp.]